MMIQQLILNYQSIDPFIIPLYQRKFSFLSYGGRRDVSQIKVVKFDDSETRKIAQQNVFLAVENIMTR
jgi:hypothetical protein